MEGTVQEGECLRTWSSEGGESDDSPKAKEVAFSDGGLEGRDSPPSIGHWAG